MFNRKKKRLEKEKRREAFRAEINRMIDGLGQAYKTALSKTNPIDRVLALQDLREQLNIIDREQSRQKKDITNREMERGRHRGRLAVLGGLATGVFAMCTGDMLPSYIDMPMEMVGYFTYWQYIFSKKKPNLGGKAMAAKEVALYQEDIADFMQAAQKMRLHIDRKIKIEKHENATSILNDKKFAHFKDKFPKLAGQFRKHVAKKKVQEAPNKKQQIISKQDNDHVYEFPKRTPKSSGSK